MAVFLAAHGIQFGRRFGVIRSEHAGKFLQNPRVFFFQSYGQGENLSRRQVFERSLHETSFAA
jgi:hypothetical protein